MRGLGLTAGLLAAALAIAPPRVAAGPAQALSAPQRPSALGKRAAAVCTAGAAVRRHIILMGTTLDDRPDSAARLTALWRTVRQWAAARLQDGQSAHQVAAAAGRDFSHCAMDLAALRLDPSSTAFTAGIEDFGTVFILRRSAGGRYVTAMSIVDPASWGARAPGQFAGWQPSHATERAQTKHQGWGWRPLTGRLYGLADQANGDRRFAIVAHYAQAAGATNGFQVSIWRWNGRTGKPLLAVELVQTADEPLIVHRGRHRWVLHAKTYFKSFDSCAACAGRQVAIPIELTPQGARLGAERPLVPELDLADAFDNRAYRCRPPGALVAPAALPRLRARLQHMCKSARLPNNPLHLGMLDAWHLTRHGSRERLCLTTDLLPYAQVFSIVRRHGRLQIAGLRHEPSGECSYRRGAPAR